MYNKYLKTFIEVADYGSFSKAAEHLYISSVGVQKQVSSLEKELDLKLFERTNQGVKLTYAGQRIYKDSKKLIEYCDNEIQNIKEKEEYCFKVANLMIQKTDIIIKTLQNKCCDNFIMIPYFPREKISFDEMKEEIKNEYDAYVFTEVANCFMGGWEYTYLFTTSLKLIVPKGNELFEKDKITYNDLENKTICFLGDGILEEYDMFKNKIMQKIPSLKAVYFEHEKLSLTDSLYVIGKHPFVLIDGMDVLVSNSKSIPFSFNTEISVGLYTKKIF